MTSRERIKSIIAGKKADRCGLWLGWPHKDTWPIFHACFGTRNDEAFRLKLKDDIRWIGAGTFLPPVKRSIASDRVKVHRHRVTNMGDASRA